jgi:hypothetical protein
MLIWDGVVEDNELNDLVDVTNVFELLVGRFDVTKVLEALDGVVDVAVALIAVHGVVGFVRAHAQREFAAPRTLPAETPQAASTQFKAADWIAED